MRGSGNGQLMSTIRARAQFLSSTVAAPRAGADRRENQRQPQENKATGLLCCRSASRQRCKEATPSPRNSSSTSGALPSPRRSASAGRAFIGCWSRAYSAIYESFRSHEGMERLSTCSLPLGVKFAHDVRSVQARSLPGRPSPTPVPRERSQAGPRRRESAWPLSQ
jgi:hypothetical protein